VAVSRLLALHNDYQAGAGEVLAWLYHEHGIEKPGNKLSVFQSLGEATPIKEVRKRRPKAAGALAPKNIVELKQVYGDYALPMQAR
jgi:hypothetical protein